MSWVCQRNGRVKATSNRQQRKRGKHDQQEWCINALIHQYIHRKANNMQNRIYHPLQAECIGYIKQHIRYG